MEIYVASFAGILSAVLLAVVYLADRYEREPIELIQNVFLLGLLAQLGPILVAGVAGLDVWSGPWLLLTAVGSALFLPFQLHRESELDERFDGIVYSVAWIGGAACAVHLFNLPRVIAAAPDHAALAPGAAPDLRDLLILATSPGLSSELARGGLLITAAVLAGAVLGACQIRGWQPSRTASACGAVALAVVGLDLVMGGRWWVRAVLAAAAVGVALAVKRRSVFRDSPQPPERDVVVLGLKTVLVVFGAVLLATVLLQAVVAPVELPGSTTNGEPAARLQVGSQEP